jgi:hypothetical protein
MNGIHLDFSPKKELLFAFTVTVFFLCYAGFATIHHEMWRDEMQSWLICRDSPSIFSVFNNIRYEGHPSLWFLLIWPLAHLTRDPSSIQVLNLLIAAVAVFVASLFAPASRTIRALAAFGYFPVYEYGSIARNYSIGVLGVILFCTMFPYRYKRPLALGMILFATANTSVHACILTIAALVIWAADLITKPWGPAEKFKRGRGLAIAAGGIIVAATQMYPPPDTGFSAAWQIAPDFGNIMQVIQTVVKGYLPLPKLGPGFWQSELLASFIPNYVGFSSFVGISILLFVCLSLIRRPLALTYYLISSFGLILFFYVKHLGYLRHHGFLFVAFITALWLRALTEPVRLPRHADSVGRMAEQRLRFVLYFILIINVIGGSIAATNEYRYIFSAAKDTSELIREKGLERFPLVADEDFSTIAVIGYLDAAQAYYPRGRRYGSFIIWDAGRHSSSDVWTDSFQLALQKKSPVVTVINYNIYRASPPIQLQPFIHREGCKSSEVVFDESFCVFLIDFQK